MLLVCSLCFNNKNKNMKPVFIAGPCVIESAGLLDEVAAELVRIEKNYVFPLFLNLHSIKPIVHPSILFVDPDYKKDYSCWQM